MHTCPGVPLWTSLFRCYKIRVYLGFHIHYSGKPFSDADWHIGFLCSRFSNTYQPLSCHFLEASVTCAYDSQSLLRACSWGMVKRKEPGPLCTPFILLCKRPRASSLLLPPENKLWVLCVEYLWLLRTVNLIVFFSLPQRASNWRMCPSLSQWTCPVVHRRTCKSPDWQTHKEAHLDFLFFKLSVIVAKRAHKGKLLWSRDWNLIGWVIHLVKGPGRFSHVKEMCRIIIPLMRGCTFSS